MIGKFALAAVSGVVLSGLAQASPPLVTPGAPGETPRAVSVEDSVAMSRTQYTAADARFMQHMIVHHAQAVEMVALIEARTQTQAVRRLGQRIALNQGSEMEMMRGWLLARGEPIEDEHLHSGHGAHAMHGANRADHGDMDHGDMDHDDMDHGAMDHDQGAMDHDDHSSHSGHGHRGAEAAAPMDPDDIPIMPGMLSPNQMTALAASSGAEFDRLFLEGMIIHHQGALDMVDALFTEPGAGEDLQLSEFLGHVVADQSAEILRMQNLLSELGSDAL